ncbi:Pyridoxine/pyridoxamine 5'-phosphate oxidase [BD1-7 clade bacterium]|uniref:Pyridoxine/pyridoxamine 5'-phosphate oxidase n=1 Tax=BD1-7 clade bacterium TaxID=2029982 RepID=A0A5S9MZU8_9GAMM|nr:Pyridoxine/pyridoxamine 5'-phosphate oxidase [BD1-7 clade bacterium]
MDLSEARREYTMGGLRRNDLPDHPESLFEHWLKQAIDAEINDPTAMTIATVDADGQPFQRIVLLKHFDKNGFVFYTNLGSRKAQQLQNNARISLHFPWHMLERQVHVTGIAERVPTHEVLRYFSSRPKESQLAAWASQQSERLSARKLLEAKFVELKMKFENHEVPLPTFWGGFRVNVSSMEFWQGGEHRLHDRFLYTRSDATWDISRLAP